ncbi:MAG TPA: hypothetical protein G4O02_14695 [Caldilineae bacterium]|nr:hypothetical protein [Caldilineae bacterium]
MFRPGGFVRLHVYVLLSLIALTFGLATVAYAAHLPPTQQTGPAVDRLYFKAFDVDRAPLDLEAGEMDLYYYSLKIAAARELRGREDIRLYQAPASTLSILLNPAPAPEGQLNPFSLLKVRQAMQHLVNREFVAREIYLGQAMPMYAHLSPTDFDYLTIYDVVQEMDLRYDPEFARAQIRDAMTEAGAELVDGVWHYNGQPVRLKFVIRIEDERRELGDLVRTELEEAGFQVDTIYQPFAPAIQMVYSSDPQQLSWHLYTEGWGRGAPQRYDFGTINQMYAPWMGNMPGWREVGFWQYENARLDELGQRLFRGEFKDRAERDEIYREMTRLGLEESVRIWVATVLNAFPARAEVQGITEDLAAGPRGIWSLREAHVPGRDELTVGHLWVWTERTTWNPIGGLGDVYSVDIWRNLHDPPIWNHPFTGMPVPFRADYEVETAGPGGKLEVPSDAVMWDVARKAWRPVGDGVTATSKVVFDYGRYFQAPWHHGQPITMADVLYSIYQSFDMAYDPDKARIEMAMAATARPYLDTFRGFRILDDERLEVYVDFWHFEPDYIASYASPAGLSMPWELLYAMDVLVFDQRRAAYSDTAAARFNVPWLSLVLDRDARLVRRVLLDLRDRAAFPEGVFTMPDGSSLVDGDIAVARYTAALDWFDEYGHLVISNGPFILARYDPAAQFAELHAFRDPAYPFKSGDFYKGSPQLVEFVSTEAGPIVPGEAYQAKVTLSGPGTLAVRYLLVDAATGEIVDRGEAEPVGADEFVISIGTEKTSELAVGLYRLLLVAYSDQLARVTEQRLDLEVELPLPETPVETPTEEPTPTAKAETPIAVGETPTVEAAETPPATETPTVESEGRAGTPLGIIIVVVVIIAVVIAAALWWTRRQ